MHLRDLYPEPLAVTPQGVMTRADPSCGTLAIGSDEVEFVTRQKHPFDATVRKMKRRREEWPKPGISLQKGI